MKLTAEAALNLIRNSKYISDNQRLDIFEFLSQTYSIIPLEGGFPTPGTKSKVFKKPRFTDWTQWSYKKNNFDRAEYYPERAGIACGPASGIMVLDVDHQENFEKWCKDNDVPPIPETLTIRTGGEGNRFHHYYKYPTDNRDYINRTGSEPFDVKVAKGFVVCPGSLHPETREPYTVENPVPVVDPPQWLLDYSLHKKTPKQMLTSPTQNQNTTTNTQPQTIMTNTDITQLKLSNDVKQMIQTDYPKGQRSEPSMTVMNALVGAGYDTGIIKHIYDTYPIGSKSREAGQDWFDRELSQAQQYIEANHNPQLTASAQTPAQAKTQPPPKQYRTFNALDVVNSTKDFKFIIDNVWPVGEPLLITGSGGVGKSVMTLQIAMDLVNSMFQPRLFLDKFQIHGEHKVLFVQSENALVGMKNRLQVIRPSYVIHDNDLREKISFLGVGDDIRVTGNVEKEAFLNVIRETIHNTGANILIIDPLISFHEKNENSNDEMRQVLDSVSMFCDEEKVTPLLIHHHAKITGEGGPGGGRGASAIGDWSPNTWELSKSKNTYKFNNRKSRNFALQDELELDLVNLRFKPASATTKQNKTSTVVQAIQALGGKASSKKVLAQKINELSKQDNGKEIATSTANSHIDIAVKEGSIVATSTTGNQKEYTLKNP